MPKRIHKNILVSEKVKDLNLIKRKIKMYSEVAKVNDKNETSPMRL